MVGERGEGANDSGLLTASLCARRDEHPGKLARQGAFSPKLASRIPKRLENDQ